MILTVPGFTKSFASKKKKPQATYTKIKNFDLKNTIVRMIITITNQGLVPFGEIVGLNRTLNP